MKAITIIISNISAEIFLGRNIFSHPFLPPLLNSASLLSLPWLRGERQGVAGGGDGPLRVPPLRLEDPEQPANHVSMQPRQHPGGGAHGRHLHRRTVEPASAAEVRTYSKSLEQDKESLVFTPFRWLEPAPIG